MKVLARLDRDRIRPPAWRPLSVEIPMNMSTKLAVVGAYVLIVSLIVFKQGFESRDYLMVIVGLMSLAVLVIILRVRRQIRRVRRR